MDKEDMAMEATATRMQKPNELWKQSNNSRSITKILEEYYTLTSLQQKAVLAYLRAQLEDTANERD